MCGRYALILREPAETLFATANRIETVPRYNIAPTQPVLAIWQSAGRREGHLARWGLVPEWVKDPRDFPLVINARAETMAEKPAFRASLRNQRCIVPATGYYEWRPGPEGTKVPHYVAMTDGSLMVLAGLYATWMGPNGEEIDSVAIITTPANADLAPLHNRMPAILEAEAIDLWLDTANLDSRAAGALARPFRPGKLTFYPVSRRVNAARNEGPDLIAPATESLEIPEDKPLQVRKKKAEQLDLF